MKMKNFFLPLLLAAMISVPAHLGAQITIGSGEAPQSFSVLELISNQSGLRLPQMTRSERNIMTETDEFQAEKTGKAMGLMIFNTTTQCVETWNGDRWVRSRNCPCGAYIAPGDWRQFACHNVGADTSLDPFTPHAGLHGDIFKWGTGIVAMTAQESLTLSTREEVDATGYTWVQRGGTPPTERYLEWDMATANPCPPGFRVPTLTEWEGVAANNPVRRVGNWTANNNPLGQGGNFSSGIHFGDALFLPTVGTRWNLGMKSNRGSHARYWSSSSINTVSWVLRFSPGSYGVTNYYRGVGFPVRCISAE